MNEGKDNLDQFLLDHIDTIPHLEALLLLWKSRPRPWSVEKMSRALFIEPGGTKSILDDLVQQELIVPDADSPETYHYEPSTERDRVVASVDAAYRTELIRISRLIHSKPSAAVRAFALAFRLKKDKE